jgi:hypothetical protein
LAARLPAGGVSADQSRSAVPVPQREKWNGTVNQAPLIVRRFHHQSGTKRARSLSANLALGRYFCHRCGSHGNQLELKAASTKISLREAAIDFCRRLGREVPWIRRW